MAGALALNAADLHLLPRNMRELAEVVGLVAFLALVETYGGRYPLRVPVKAHPDHALWALIGPDAFRALVARYQNELIEIARCQRAARELQRRAIRHEYFALNRSQDLLAHKYSLTVRHVRNILYYIRAPEEDRNGRLF